MTNSELIPCPTLKELDIPYRRNGFEALDAYEWTGRLSSQVCNCQKEVRLKTSREPLFFSRNCCRSLRIGL